MLYLKLLVSFTLAKWDCFCNFGRGQYEKYFCEIISNSDLVHEILLEYYLIFLTLGAVLIS